MNKKNRLVGLDLMRALAILLVVYQHGQFFFYPYINSTFGNLTFATFGYFGVEMFFVLSGFLIGSIFLSSYYEKEKFEIKQVLLFWKRRWMRTLPNYYFMLTILIVWAIIANQIPKTNQLPSDRVILQYLFFAQNMYTFSNHFFLQAWSLSVEEWFYLIFPVFVISISALLPQFRKRSVFFVAIILILICNVLRYVGYSKGIPWQEMKLMTIFRLDSIIYGVLIALIYFRFGEVLDRYKNIMALCGALFLLIMVFIQVNYIVVAAPIELAGIFILSLSGLTFGLMLPFFKNLKWNPDQVLGKMVRHVSLISYSIYLNHLFISLLIGKYFMASNLIQGITAFCLYVLVTMAMSTIQYTYLEKYFLKIRDRINLKV